MEIGGPYPFRAAVAYQPGRAQAIPTRQSATTDTTQPVNPGGMDRLVAGRVQGGLDFDPASISPIIQGNTLQLYTRHADLIEAATGVERGRIVDLRG